MPQVIDEYTLDDIIGIHQVNVGVYIPFVIARLAQNQLQNEALLTVTLRNLSNSDETQHQLRLRWSAASVPELPLAIPERTLTEWAACGVACAVLARYTSLYINRMAEDGDRFDYWVRSGALAYGLEVSGTITEETEYRARLKARQLRENPYGVAGYVIVTNFATQEVICAFHPFEEDKI